MYVEGMCNFITYSEVTTRIFFFFYELKTVVIHHFSVIKIVAYTVFSWLNDFETRTQN